MFRCKKIKYSENHHYL